MRWLGNREKECASLPGWLPLAMGTPVALGLGGLLGRLGRLLGRLGAFLGRLGGVVGVSWAVLGAPWAVLSHRGNLRQALGRLLGVRGDLV